VILTLRRVFAVVVVVAAIGFGIYFAADDTPNLTLSRLGLAGGIVAGLAAGLFSLAYLAEGRSGPPPGP